MAVNVKPPRGNRPTGKPGDIDLGGGRTYNPVTQQYGGGETPKPEEPTGDENPKKPTGDTQPEKEDPYVVALREERARLERLRIMNARAVLEAQMAAYGLGGLAARVTSWIQEGYDADAVMALVRQSDEYAARFPAMKALQARGQSISEQEYISYEQEMVSIERLYGLPSGMLSGKDMVTKSLTNGLSAREVDERATRASASMYKLPQQFRDTMRDFYGVDSGGLTAFFLDPDVASPLLEKQYVTAQIGAEATMQGLNVGRALSESLYEYGVNEQQARAGFAEVKDRQELLAGKGETATQESLIGASLTGNQQDRQQVERIAGARKGRFEGGGGYVAGQKGVSGVGSATT